MRLRRRSPITPSMGVAITALAVALGGTAFAAAGSRDFASSDTGLVQACVAQKDIVNSIVDPVAGVVNSATAGALTSVTTAVTPVGTLIVVPPGTACPANTAPQSLSSTPAPAHDVAQSRAVPVGASKEELTSLMVPAGTQIVNGKVTVTQLGTAVGDQTIKCTFVDADGNTIPNTTSTETIPAGSAGLHLTIPLSALVTLAAPGRIGLDCKESGAAAGGARNAHTAQPLASDFNGQMDY
jgi:hypothetical protein